MKEVSVLPFCPFAHPLPLPSDHHMSPHHVPASIVDKQRTSPLYNRTTFQTRLTPRLPFRRRFAEICPYSGWHLYVSLDIYFYVLAGPYPLLKMGVLVDVLVRVEFYLAEAAVSLDNMGEYIDVIAYPCLNGTTDLWSDTPSHPCERVDQLDPEQLEENDRLSGI